jgi:hypothetical protein
MLEKGYEPGGINNLDGDYYQARWSETGVLEGDCMICHQPGWKKRGANFDARTDVHLAAGLKCVDCHPAGSKALDNRINEKEMHQFSKGDDPGGNVRNDLDNSVVDCNYCHTNGYMGAPVARHKWLPDLHLDYISCQTCPVQASDVFNPGTKIPSKGKHLWVFYGPDMKYYNHYGNMAMMGFDDKPTDVFKPVLARYKGKIRPVNRVHSAWPGIAVEGKPGLMQPNKQRCDFKTEGFIPVHKCWECFSCSFAGYSVYFSPSTGDHGHTGTD